MASWRYKISPLVLKKCFTRPLRSLVKYFFQHVKRNFVSLRGHVISSISTASNLHHHLLAVLVVKFWKLLHRPFPKPLVAINLTL